MKVCIAQFEGIDNPPALPLATGQLIASARQNSLRGARPAARQGQSAQRFGLQELKAFLTRAPEA